MDIQQISEKEWYEGYFKQKLPWCFTTWLRLYAPEYYDKPIPTEMREQLENEWVLYLDTCV